MKEHPLSDYHIKFFFGVSLFWVYLYRNMLSRDLFLSCIPMGCLFLSEKRVLMSLIHVVFEVRA